MNKHTLSLAALATTLIFSAGVQAQKPLQSDRSFDFNTFYSNKMPADTMVSKEQYMMEMERRWMMAEKMMVDNPKKGWVNHGMLMKAMKDESAMKGGGAQ